jgi:hypothetical protein
MTLTKIAALVAGLALVAFAASGMALAGNSTAAKRCQKNGWQSLVTSGGTSFASVFTAGAVTWSSNDANHTAWFPTARNDAATQGWVQAVAVCSTVAQ